MTRTIGTRDKAIPTNPSNVPAHPYPRFENNCGAANGRNAPKLFRPNDAAESAEAAYFSYASVK